MEEQNGKRLEDLIEDSSKFLHAKILRQASIASLPDPPNDRPNFLVERLLPAAALSILQGDGGTGKTYLALELAACISTGRPFLGLPTTKRNVLYIDTESGAEEIARRRNLAKHWQKQDFSRVEIVFATEQLNPLDAINPDWIFEPIRVADNPGLIIIDNLSVLALGGDINRSDVVVKYIKALQLATIKNKVAILLLDYPAKYAGAIAGGEEEQSKATPYGSAVKGWLARTILQLTKHKSTNEKITALTLRITKSNFSSTATEIDLSLCFDDEGRWWTDSGSTSLHGSKGEVLDLLMEAAPRGFDVETIAERIGVTGRTVKIKLSALLKEGKVRYEQSSIGKKTWYYNGGVDGF